VKDVTPEQVESEILAEIKRMRDNVRQEELQRVINQMESSFIFMLDSNDGIAHQLSYYQTVSGNWRYVTDYIEKISGLTVHDIKAAADKYLNDRNRVTAVLRDSRSKK